MNELVTFLLSIPCVGIIFFIGIKIVTIINEKMLEKIFFRHKIYWKCIICGEKIPFEYSFKRRRIHLEEKHGITIPRYFEYYVEKEE